MKPTSEEEDMGRAESVGGWSDQNPHAPIFTELLELTEYPDGAKEWKEVARWVKYEETVEEAGNRWSKPHISTPALQGVLQLRRLLKNGIILLDLDATNFKKICNAVKDVLETQGDVTKETGGKFRDLLLFKHRHQFEGPRKVETGLTSVIKELLVQKLEKKGGNRSREASRTNSRTVSRRGSMGNLLNDLRAENGENLKLQASIDDGKVNRPFLKKLPGNSEAAVVLEGRASFLQKPISVFIRLLKPVVLGDLPEVDIPTKYLYFVVGSAAPRKGDKVTCEVGRAMGTAFSDKCFGQMIHEADSKEDIVEALDEFVDSIKTLPRDWNVKNYIDPPLGEDEKEKELQVNEEDVIDDDRRSREASGLVRTGRLFGGLINDIKRKKPHYLSDFIDGFHPQCISSFLFLYFACLAPIIAFGALLGQATKQRIATIEGLVAGLISGVAFSLFSGQPLNLLGSTGPVYVFEKILFEMCDDQNWDYLSLRLWIGIWVGAILLLLVMFDASAYVCYITRFTEELFATLVAFIFIMSAFKNTFGISEVVANWPCECIGSSSGFTNQTGPLCYTDGGDLVGSGCEHGDDVYLMSLILFFGAFFISITLKQFKTTGYLPTSIRHFLADFAVIIGIITMTALDYFYGLPTPKLVVPSEFKPTWEGRDWVVSHALLFPEHLLTNPWWVDVFLAPVFAILATILIFMDQQITAVIVNRKEYKLQKGCGYHLDLLVLAFVIIISSVFGLPWFIANTIPSINHMQSLTKESKTNIPGEKPQFLGVREQRLTSLAIAILTGLSVLMTPVLALLPMPVLYGVFLFMGVMSLRGLQFFDRILLLFMPTKYQPNFTFLKFVQLGRVHLFTLVQALSLIILWAVKSYNKTSIAFPVMLVVICVIRKMIECIFTNGELRALDDLLPERKKDKRKLGYKKSIKGLTLTDSDEEEIVELNSKPAGILNGNKQKQEKKANGDTYHISIDTELEELMSFEPRPPKYPKRRSLPKVVSTNNVKSLKLNGLPEKVTLMFLRMNDDEVFIPIHLTPVTYTNLVNTLTSKFDSLRGKTIKRLMQKTKAGITFVLDESMVDYIENRTVFVMDATTDDEKLTSVTLREQTI